MDYLKCQLDTISLWLTLLSISLIGYFVFAVVADKGVVHYSV